MYKTDEFIMMMDRDFEYPFNKLLRQGHFSADVKKFSDINKKELLKYTEERASMVLNYKNNWLKILYK